ncbi:MAG: tetratricopeptide repeat protein [Acidobacteriota bacterium]|jgi:tetratricopeptide (TPR) repeat protein
MSRLPILPLLAMLFTLAPADPVAAAADPVAEARRALAEERPEDAVTILEGALEAVEGGAPQARRADLHALLGRALALGDRYAEAADHLERAVALGRADLGTLLYLGSSQWEVQRFEPAVETLQRAAERSAGTPSEFLAHHQLGRLLLFLGRPADALGALERAAELRPEAFDARLDLARALDRSGATERAVTAYREVVEMAPQSPHARWGLGQALVRLGEREAAAEHLAVYREIYEAQQEETREGFLVEARLARARELFEARRLDEAERIVVELPETAGTLEALARIRATGGDFQGAVEALEKAVSRAPDREDLRRLLAEARLLAREVDDGR